MLNFLSILALISALIAPVANVFAASSGLLINNDSVMAYYLGEANNLLPRHSRQQYSLILSKEPDPRNFLLAADAELLDYQKPLKKDRSLTPKIAAFLANFHDQNLLALGGGAIFRQLPNETRKYELLSELLIAPHISNHSDTGSHPWSVDIKWSWSFKLQANYPLADDTEFNFGLRAIHMRTDKQHNESFETGPFIGLSSHF